MVLDKNKSMFVRDEDGKLLPMEVELAIDATELDQLEYKGETILMLPITRGASKKLFSEVKAKGTDKDLDADIIEKYCIEPKYTKEEIDAIKPTLASLIVSTILQESGIVSKNKTAKKALNEAEDEFSKN